jgi:hypothetical protein
MMLLTDDLLEKPAPGRRLGRKYRDKLRWLLTILLGNYPSGDDSDPINALHEKYGNPFAEKQRMEMDLTRGVLEGFGVEFDEDYDARDAEDLVEYARRQMHEHFEQTHDEERRRQTAEERASSRPRSAKAQAAAAKRDEAARAVSQSIREVFRKLVSALHPDREPDPEERQRKNELMQEVNRAYEADDLLTLLELQLRIEQIDAAQLSSLAPEKLARFNQILREQLADLDQEFGRFTEPFRMIVLDSGASLTTANVDRELDREMAQMHTILRELRADMAAFRDPAQLRSRLDAIDEGDDPIPLDDFDDFQELAALMHSAQTPRRPRKPKRRGGKSRRS